MQLFASRLPVLAAVLALLAGAAMTAPAVADDSSDDRSDDRAHAIAERVMDALGGEQAWQQTRFLRFTFAGARTHYWDKETGRHRLESTDRDGHERLVLHNVQSRDGRAWLDGQELEGEALAEALENAYGAWINDTYWLLMPYKLRDPGVNLSYDKEVDIANYTYDRLHLSFDSVGLTPGDQYWVYVHRETGLVDRWEYFLQSYEPGSTPTQWVWSDWRRYGGIKLASGRTNPESGRELPLTDIAVFDSLPDAVFTSTGEASLP
jgi:hypothetical protein